MKDLKVTMELGDVYGPTIRRAEAGEMGVEKKRKDQGGSND